MSMMLEWEAPEPLAGESGKSYVERVIKNLAAHVNVYRREISYAANTINRFTVIYRLADSTYSTADQYDSDVYRYAFSPDGETLQIREHVAGTVVGQYNWRHVISVINNGTILEN